MEFVDLLFSVDVFIKSLVEDHVGKAYFVFFLIIMLETGLILFPFLPGDGLLFSIGVVAASSVLNVWYLLVLLIVAAFVGNLLNYQLGVVLGSRLKRSRYSFVVKYIIPKIIQAELFYKKHGYRAVVIGRFFPVVRTYVPFVAGVVKMNYRKFLFYTTFGAVVWVSFFMLIGFFLGEIPWVKQNYLTVFGFLIFLTALPFVYAFVKKIINK